jgi:hypothetical protein
MRAEEYAAWPRNGSDSSLRRFAGLWLPHAGQPRSIPYPPGHDRLLSPVVWVSSPDAAHVIWASTDAGSRGPFRPARALWYARWSEQGWSPVESLGAVNRMRWNEFDLRAAPDRPLIAVGVVPDTILVMSAESGRWLRHYVEVGGLPSVTAVARVDSVTVVAFDGGRSRTPRHDGVDVIRSHDGGQTWSRARELFRSQHATVQAVELVPLGGSRILAVWSVPDSDGAFATTIFGAESFDAGNTWQQPAAVVAPEPFAALSVVADSAGEASLLAGGLGTWLLMARWRAGHWLWGRWTTATTVSRPVVADAGRHGTLSVWGQYIRTGSDSLPGLQVATNARLSCPNSRSP